MIIVFDLEFTTWDGAQDRGWSGPGEFREIVQFGAVRVDSATLEITGELDLLVRPVRNPSLSPFFQELTGISQADVDARGLPFLTALDQFIDFCAGHYVLSYGNDMVVVGENLVLQVPEGRAPKRGMPPFVNIRPYVNSLLPMTRGESAGRIAFAAGLTGAVDREHNALADCYSIVATLRHLRALGHPLIAVEG
ncbi:exonuclease domain-containing protein [Actinoplanes bogorensis]|uniref:Exonuclease domain-containing protein n=1 Tax=Paractinoplanes bogorensis TaxID=1610840 RepID=A0ABS5Z458_9ACTN|nr:3'-5' exonuclease [Actinoplanes bogorensis]MBU2670480.1 exonuclease domain-containing protein [Actinoplanes bogorensis]